MAERGLSVDHTTVWRWVQAYGPEVYRRLAGEVKRKSSTWHMDETFVRIAGRWMYLFRPSTAAAKQWTSICRKHGTAKPPRFSAPSPPADRQWAPWDLKKALANGDNRPPCVFARDGLRNYPAAIRDLEREGELHRHCRQRTRRYCNNRIESDHRHIKRRLRAMQGPRTTATASAVIQGIEASQMIRKGQVLGITRPNLYLNGYQWLIYAPLHTMRHDKQIAEVKATPEYPK